MKRLSRVQFIVENKNRYKLSTQPANKYLFLMFSLKKRTVHRQHNKLSLHILLTSFFIVRTRYGTTTKFYATRDIHRV